jgi:hypothetical protein
VGECGLSDWRSIEHHKLLKSHELPEFKLDFLSFSCQSTADKTRMIDSLSSSTKKLASK